MELAAKIAQLTPLSGDAQQWLAEHTEVRTFKKGETILREGKLCNDLYYVHRGMLSGHYLHDGRMVCNWISAEGDFATSYYSFISRQGSYEEIVALEDTTAACIGHAQLHELYRLFPETEKAGRLLLEAYYLRLEERLISIQFRSAKERYAYLYETRPEMIKRAPLGRIASYLGMTQETLSRIRAEL